MKTVSITAGFLSAGTALLFGLPSANAEVVSTTKESIIIFRRKSAKGSPVSVGLGLAHIVRWHGTTTATGDDIRLAGHHSFTGFAQA